MHILTVPACGLSHPQKSFVLWPVEKVLHEIIYWNDHDQLSLPVIAVSVIKDHPPADIKSPLNWLLLCIKVKANAENALRFDQWYETLGVSKNSSWC